MQSISNLPAPTNDLRGNSKDYLRDHEHKAKWGTDGALRPCMHTGSDWPHQADPCEKCHPRPPHRGARQSGRHATHKLLNEYKGVGKKKVFARKAIGNEILAAEDGPLAGLSDTSGDESVTQADSANVPDAEVMYSYDAQRGPTRGSDILGVAVGEAVKRYENKQTEKLVKEYDLVEDLGDDGNEADVDEDGFEIVDISRLN